MSNAGKKKAGGWLLFAAVMLGGAAFFARESARTTATKRAATALILDRPFVDTAPDYTVAWLFAVMAVLAVLAGVIFLASSSRDPENE